MGCGSSSLKGDAPSGLNADDAPQPIRKVNTNFSTINYDQDQNKKRRMTEYAPHETIDEGGPARNRSEASGVDPNRPPASSGKPSRAAADADDVGPDGNPLEPYHTMSEDPNAIPLKDRGYPHENAAAAGAPNGVNGDGGPDPTSNKAKDEFASANDPLNHQTASAAVLPPPEGESPGEKKKRTSFMDRFRGGETREISDEEMKKYTGKTKAEMTEYMKTGPGVGGRQGARDYSVSGDGGGASFG